MNQIHVLNQEEINYIWPKLYNNEMISDKGIMDKYWTLVAIYRYYFEKYISQLLDLKKYDDMIENSSLVFKTVQSEQQDIYQRWSNIGLKYIYIRNNIYIENLTIEELNQLISGVIDEEFIERTYHRLIHPNVSENCYSINYGPASKQFMVSPDSIVLGIRFADSSIGESDIDRTLNRIEKDSFIEELIHQIKNDNKKFLLTIINYNDESVFVKR